MRLIDIQLAFPGLLLAIALIAVPVAAISVVGAERRGMVQGDPSSGLRAAYTATGGDHAADLLHPRRGIRRGSGTFDRHQWLFQGFSNAIPDDEAALRLEYLAQGSSTKRRGEPGYYLYVSSLMQRGVYSTVDEQEHPRPALHHAGARGCEAMRSASAGPQRRREHHRWGGASQSPDDSSRQY